MEHRWDPQIVTFSLLCHSLPAPPPIHYLLIYFPLSFLFTIK